MTNPVAHLFDRRAEVEPDDELSFELLGPLRAWRGGEEIDLGTPQQRAVLAVLLLAEGAAVPVDEVVERVWGEDAPRSARGILRTYVYRLRRALEAAAPGSELIEFVAGSYRMRSSHLRVDATEFSDLVRSAEEVVRVDAHSARETLRSALALWHGNALQGFEADWLSARRRWLESRRTDALIALFPLELADGEPGELLTTIGELWRQQPTHEKLAELYMAGLWRRNERSSALAVYEEVRRVLADELGIDPSADLQAMHLQILRSDAPEVRGDTALAVAPADPAFAASADPALAAAAGPALVPSQLPYDGSPFVGREREVAMMTALLTGPTVRHVGMVGLGGLGKTRLAVRVAHRAKEAFPDGQLFVRLQGESVSDVLGDLLESVGVRRSDLPPGADRRAALWRTITSQRRLLVLIDDAVASPDLALLLPAGERSAAIITAARRIVGLTGVAWTRLTPLSTSESVELMGILAGRSRVMAEEETARRVAEECSNIPLAVEVAATRLNDRPHWSILRIEQQLLDDLQSPVVMQEDCAIVDAPLERAESYVDVPTLLAGHRLAVSAPEVFDAEWAAAELRVEVDVATRILEDLTDAGLLVSGSDEEYSFLSLVRAFSRRQAIADSLR